MSEILASEDTEIIVMDSSKTESFQIFIVEEIIITSYHNITNMIMIVRFKKLEEL